MAKCARHLGNLITWNLKYDDHYIQVSVDISMGMYTADVPSLKRSIILMLPPNFLCTLLFFYGSKQWKLSQIIWWYIYPMAESCVGDFWYTISYTYLLPYVVRCEHIRENLIKRFKKFSFTNVKQECICSTFGFQCSFDSTPIGLNRKIVSSRNSVGTDENGREWDFFHALNYTFALANGIFSSFKEMILMH